jgi:hypothetical protein
MLREGPSAGRYADANLRLFLLKILR